MAGECDRADRLIKNACPLQCGLRTVAAGDGMFDGQSLTRDHVDWAGFPINLDYAFSQQQCDKVFAQHLMRRRGAQLRRWLREGAEVCVCETVGQERVDSNAVESIISH